MNIRDFYAQYGGNTRKINDVMRQWQLVELDGLLRTLRNQHDQLIGSAVIVGDAIHGGTLLDDLPRDLKDAFFGLMHEKADTYREMREILLDHMHADNGGFLPLGDRHVVGFINYLKGRIGENLFQHHVGSAATLAELVNQEGWDVSVRQADGLQHYVQVKLYDKPYGVVRHMLKVQRKIAAQTITGIDHHTPVDHIYFAVPEDIKGEVLRLAEKHDGLSSMIYEKSIPIDAHSAKGIVAEGMSNIGPDQLNHFFGELLCGAVAAGSLHAVVNGFLWYKGSKEFSAAFAGATASTAISTTGVGMGLAAEMLGHTVMLSSAVGIGTRLLLGRMARSRWNFAEFLERSISETDSRLAALQPAMG